MARIVFMGSPDFAVPSLRALVEAGHEVVAVYTQPDREAGRGHALMSPAVKRAALELGLPVKQPPTLRRAAAVDELAALQPDLIAVAAFGQILRANVLAIPHHGTLNVHASLLPRWRGASPVTAAIAAGDDVTGVSIMLLDEGLDTGPVLSVRPTWITPQDTGGTLTDRLATLGADLLVETLRPWLAGRLQPQPQDGRFATLAGKLAKEAGQIDWSADAPAIWRSVRAYTPWPGAFTSYRDAQLRILEAWPVPDQHPDAAPGEVTPLPPNADLRTPAEAPRPAFAIATGSGMLLPLKLQRAGKRPLFAEEFARGEHGLIGTRLGGMVQ